MEHNITKEKTFKLIQVRLDGATRGWIVAETEEAYSGYQEVMITDSTFLNRITEGKLVFQKDSIMRCLYDETSLPFPEIVKVLSVSVQKIEELYSN